MGTCRERWCHCLSFTSCLYKVFFNPIRPDCQSMLFKRLLMGDMHSHLIRSKKSRKYIDCWKCQPVLPLGRQRGESDTKAWYHRLGAEKVPAIV